MECPFYHLNRIQEVSQKTSLKQALYIWLERVQIPNLDEWIDRLLKVKGQLGSKAEGSDNATQFFTSPDTDPQINHARKVAIFLLTYRNHPRWNQYSKVLQLLLKFEQSVLVWKTRHPRMVEMIMIGRRVGTGGSSGVAYLDSTSLPQYRVFSDLIRIRGESIASYKLGGYLDEEGIWNE